MLHGEPDAGNLHVRFEEGRVDRPSLGRPLSYSTGSWTYADYGSVVPGRNNRRGTQTARTSALLTRFHSVAALAPGGRTVNKRRSIDEVAWSGSELCFAMRII